jgi:hypothetical protein
MVPKVIFTFVNNMFDAFKHNIEFNITILLINNDKEELKQIF